MQCTTSRRAVPIVFLGALALLVVGFGHAHADPRDLAGGASFGLAGAIGAKPQGAASIVTNPAALGLIPSFDIAFLYGNAQLENNDFNRRYVRLRGEIPSRLNPLVDIEEAAELRRELRNLDSSDVELRSTSFLGVAASFKGFTLGAFQYELTETRPVMDRVNTDLTGPEEPTSLSRNVSRFDARGMEIREFALSYSAPLGEGGFMAFTPRYLQGRTYFADVPVFGTALEREDFIDLALEENEYSGGAFTADLAIMGVAQGYSFGVIVRNLWDDPLATDGRGNYSFDRQWRIAGSITASERLVISADFDIVPFETAMHGVEKQQLHGGAEIGVGGGFVLRAGLFYDLMADDNVLNFGFGAGFIGSRLQLEFGALQTEVSSPLHWSLTARIGF